MGITRLNNLPDGSGNLTNDDLFLFMDDPSGSGVTKKISLSQLSSAVGGGISNLVEDITPQLGGNLDLNSYSINGTGSLNISGSGNFTQGLFVNYTGVSLSGHTHNSSDITDFNTSISGLLPVKNVLGSGNINITSSSQVFTISSSGLVQSNTVGIAGASGVNNIIQISQANYDALVTKDPNTVYFIV